MNLAIITHKFIKGDGQGRVNYEIAEEATRQGHQVFLVGSEISPELHDNPSVSTKTISVDAWPTDLVRNQVFAAGTTHWLEKHRNELDVIHVNGFTTWAAGDVNTCHFVHSSWLPIVAREMCSRLNVQSFYQWLYTLLGTHLERLAFSKAKVVVAVSESVQKDLVRLGVSPDRVRVISNGVDADEFRPPDFGVQRFEFARDALVGLFVGEVTTRRKNLDTLLHALLRVPRLHLVVVGGLGQSSYPQLVVRMGLADRVHFLGYRRDVAAIMRSCDIFLLP